MRTNINQRLANRRSVFDRREERAQAIVGNQTARRGRLHAKTRSGILHKRKHCRKTAEVMFSSGVVRVALAVVSKMSRQDGGRRLVARVEKGKE